MNYIMYEHYAFDVMTDRLNEAKACRSKRRIEERMGAQGGNAAHAIRRGGTVPDGEHGLPNRKPLMAAILW